jgi:hypothetical protein
MLAEHMQRRKTPKSTVNDEYKRYLAREEDIEHPDGHLIWWAQHLEEYPLLAQMARDRFSIPGMSADVERLFSSAKLMLPASRNLREIEQIEAGECVRS